MKKGKITGTKAASKCAMPLSTFRYRAAIYEKAIYPAEHEITEMCTFLQVAAYMKKECPNAGSTVEIGTKVW